MGCHLDVFFCHLRCFFLSPEGRGIGSPSEKSSPFLGGRDAQLDIYMVRDRLRTWCDEKMGKKLGPKEAKELSHVILRGVVSAADVAALKKYSDSLREIF